MAPLTRKSRAAAAARAAEEQATSSTKEQGDVLHAVGQQASNLKQLLFGKQTEMGAALAYHAINRTTTAMGNSITAPERAVYDWLFGAPSPTAGRSPLQARTERRRDATHKPPAAFVPNPVSRVSVLNGGKKTSGSPGGTGGTGGTGGGGPTSPPGTTGGSTYSSAQLAEAAAQMEGTYGIPASIAVPYASWYAGEIANSQTSDQIQNAMYTQPWFKQAFPGLYALMANGQSPPSNVATPLQYAQDYASVQEMTASYGAPSAVSPALYGELVANGLTSADIKNNLSAVFSGSSQTNKEAQALLSQWYGVPNTPGAIATLMIDPNGALARANAGAGVMPSQQLAGQVGQAAQGGAMAGQSGFNKLSKSDLLGMASTATGSQIGAAASADVGTLSATQAGTTNAPTVTEAQLLESGANPGIQATPGAQQAVQRAVGARAAQFGGGGGVAGAGQPGESGAGYGTQ